ncbi:sulfurtransferase TusA family protein [bacterium]|nr:sulfurtransferase TusA family protein [bacterium]MBU1615448.1 sulfurtransferase TusA family protein [bacterium]
MATKFEKKGEGEYLLDVCGQVCPYPQLYTKKSLEKIDSGDRLELIFDNPSSGETIIQFCETGGHEIVEQKEDGNKRIFIIEKG